MRTGTAPPASPRSSSLSFAVNRLPMARASCWCASPHHCHPAAHRIRVGIQGATACTITQVLATDGLWDLMSADEVRGVLWPSAASADGNVADAGGEVQSYAGASDLATR
eukprot:7285845-Prymnesium_polylepis.1